MIYLVGLGIFLFIAAIGCSYVSERKKTEGWKIATEGCIRLSFGFFGVSAILCFINWVNI